MILSRAVRSGRQAGVLCVGALALSGWGGSGAQAETLDAASEVESTTTTAPNTGGEEVSTTPAPSDADEKKPHTGPSANTEQEGPKDELEKGADQFQEAAKDAKPKDYREGIGFAGLPLANYNTDDGFGYGVKVAMYDYGKNQKPYKWQLAVQLFFTTKKVQYHRIFFDAPRFMGTPWRVEVRLNYDRVLQDNYFGIGNEVPVCPWTGYELDGTAVGGCPTDDVLEANTGLEDPSQLPDGLTGDLASEYDRIQNYYTSFQKKEPKLILNLRRDLTGPFKLFSGLQVKRTFIQPHDAAALEQYGDLEVPETWTSFLATEGQQPYGFSGGTLGYVQLGIILDSRNREPSPDRGTFSEVSGRVAYNVPVSDVEQGLYSPLFAGLNLTTRNYVSIVPNLVFASRVVADLMVGDVPFYDLTTFGGSQNYSGLGGDVSVRGLRSNRFRGKAKVLVTPELRWTPVEFYAAKQKFNISFVGFADAGRTWKEYSGDGDLSTVHLGVGGGLRIAWNDNFLIRLDVGKNIETNAALEIPNAGAITGFYLTFDHAF